jgi:hypothetical protein
MKSTYKPHTSYEKTKVNYPSKEIDVRQYTPQEVFGLSSDASYQALAKAFYNTRYRDNGDRHNSHFDKNMGVTQLYNDTLPISKIYNSPSERYEVNFNKDTNPNGIGQATSYGHSERIQMKDLLNDLIKNSETHEITRPNMNKGAGASYQKNLEELKYLATNAKTYQDYLNKKNHVVKMWSERGPCNRAGPEGNCAGFIESILPKGSAYGYLTPYTPGENVENISTQLKNAYLGYKKSTEQLSKSPSNPTPTLTQQPQPLFDMSQYKTTSNPFADTSPNYTVPSILDKSRYEFSPEKTAQLSNYPTLPSFDYNDATEELTYISKQGNRIPFDSNTMGFSDPNKHWSVQKKIRQRRLCSF